MASARKHLSEQEHLGVLARQVTSLQDEAKRLNRRLRNARAATQAFEDQLAALAEQIEQRRTQLLQMDQR